MPTEKRIRKDFPNPELAMARVFRARKEYECAMCVPFTQTVYPIGDKSEWRPPIYRGEVYARISETRLPVCSAHFTIDDVVTITKERKP